MSNIVPIEDFSLYLKIKQICKKRQYEYLAQMHPEYLYLVFKNSQAKMLFNKDLTFLHILCKTRGLDHLKTLEKDFIQKLINTPNEIGWTPIYFSIKKNDYESVEFLLSNEAQLSSAKFSSPLILAVQNAGKPLFELIYKRVDKEMLNYQDEEGITALFIATYSRKLDLIKLLIEDGAKYNILDKKGATILHWAARTEDLDIIRYFFSLEGVLTMLNQRDHKGNSVLHYLAEECDMPQIYEELFNRGADLNTRNEEGLLPEEYALEFDNFPGET